MRSVRGVKVSRDVSLRHGSDELHRFFARHDRPDLAQWHDGNAKLDHTVVEIAVADMGAD